MKIDTAEDNIPRADKPFITLIFMRNCIKLSVIFILRLKCIVSKKNIINVSILFIINTCHLFS